MAFELPPARRPGAVLRAVALIAVGAVGASAQTAPERSLLPPDRAAISFASAIRAVRADDWAAAEAAARRAGPTAETVVTWRRLRAGAGTWDEARAFLQAHPDWPEPEVIRARAESGIPPNAAPAQVLAWFDGRPPRTAAGSLALIAALAATGSRAEAEAEAVRAWTQLAFSDLEETALMAGFAAVLSDHHAARMDMLLWSGRTDEAERLLPRLSDARQRLARARIALQERRDGVDALIAAVPSSLADDPGLAHDRFHWRMTSRFYDGAIALLLERSASAEALGRPEGWAVRRAWLAREQLAAGNARQAYAIASSHRLTDGARFADLEWLSGFIALRHLDRPADALRHFEALAVRSGSPISLGRAGYWAGLALEAMGRSDDARARFAEAGQHQTAFYGQLAAERAGLPMDPELAQPRSFPGWRDAAFTRSPVFGAAMLLYRAGDWYEARRFFLHLGAGLSGTELGQFGDFLLDELAEPNFALQLAKDAVTRGELLMRAYFPVSDLVTLDLPIPHDLALAIARRESEFDSRVVSPAGAQGLMQVMPATGELTARRIGVAFDRAGLLADADYNAVLGSHYLAGLLEEFGPALVLVSAGYNAGPGRPRSWIEELGDPRLPGVDPVDWIESIPFTETRNYVMRVLEAVVVYRARLAGTPQPFGLSAELRGR